jgi:hypothetical protein
LDFALMTLETSNYANHRADQVENVSSFAGINLWHSRELFVMTAGKWNKKRHRNWSCTRRPIREMM